VHVLPGVGDKAPLAAVDPVRAVGVSGGFVATRR
jgi:hypothetical protein